LAGRVSCDQLAESQRRLGITMATIILAALRDRRDAHHDAAWIRQMNLHRLWLHVYDYNPRAIALRQMWIQARGVLAIRFYRGRYHDDC